MAGKISELSAATAAAAADQFELLQSGANKRLTVSALFSDRILALGIPGADDTYNGIALTGNNAGATIAQWEAVYMGATFEWLIADANGSGTYPAMGLATAAGSDGNPLTVLVRGIARNDAWNWSVGLIYLSDSVGALTQTPPSTSGDKVQIVGYALSADTMMVDPDLTYLTVT